MKKFCMDINDSYISPATDAKSEKVSPFSMDGLINKDIIAYVPDLVDKYNFLCGIWGLGREIQFSLQLIFRANPESR